MKRFLSIVFCLWLAGLLLPPRLSYGTEINLFGPEKFTRQKWLVSDVYTRTFSVSHPREARLVARPGVVGATILARITLNGKVVSDGDDSLPLKLPLDVPVELLESNTLRITLYGNRWSFLTLAIIGEEGGVVEILEPAEDVAAEGCKTAVHGTVTGMTAPWGVAVNGQPALVWEDRFSASGIPLHEGENTLTAVATDGEGRTAKASRTVFALPTGEGITVSVSPESGLSPLETTLSIDASFLLTSSALHHTGPGREEILESDAGHYRLRISEPGLHIFTVDVMKEADRPFRDSAAVLVMDKPDFDEMIREKWAGMTSALLSGDIPKAVGYFDENTRDLYREIFETLGADLPRITGEMRDIEFVSMEDNLAKYRLQKEQLYGGKMMTITYYVYFIKDGSGLWKIYRY